MQYFFQILNMGSKQYSRFSPRGLQLCMLAFKHLHRDGDNTSSCWARKPDRSVGKVIIYPRIRSG